MARHVQLRHAPRARRRAMRGAVALKSAVLPVLLLLIAAAVVWLPRYFPAPGPGPAAATGGDPAQPPPPDEAATDPAAAEPDVAGTAPAQRDAVFTIVAGGDVLPHATVIRTAREDATGEGYDFGPMLAATRPWTQGADLALCNMEVPVAPEGTAPSGYPLFGAPAELAADLRELGWDGCTTATNHTLDRGMAGVTRTLDVFDEAGLGHVGSARSIEEAAQPQWYELEREGQVLRVASIAATYGTNGIPLPDHAPWAVQLIDAEQLIGQARAARAAGADLVLASIHCCTEYRGEPQPAQVAVAEALAASGAVDLLIGHHAHVPQPIEHLAGGPGGDGMWAVYGLGNFISNQDEYCCVPETATGLLATAAVVKPPDGPARVRGVEWTAVTVDRVGAQRLHVLAELMAGPRPAGLALSEAQLAARYQGVLDVVGDVAAERTQPPVRTGPRAMVVPRGERP